MLDLDLYLEKIEVAEDKAALNFVNALEDLLWAFELRARASWIFQLAIKRNIYHTDVFRYIHFACEIIGKHVLVIMVYLMLA